MKHEVKTRWVVMYEDGKVYEIDCEDRADAERVLADAIAEMGGDNWCGLHLEELPEEWFI